MDEGINITINRYISLLKKNHKGITKAILFGLYAKKNVRLESDIEITAQPPGKKMKNLNLLSGGEKALTAISILFSIILAKPTPFCILDEIEAPLDDANIFRFGEFLKELSNETQFTKGYFFSRRNSIEVYDKLIICPASTRMPNNVYFI